MNSYTRYGIIILALSFILWIVAFTFDLILSISLGGASGLLTSSCCFISPIFFIVGIVLIIVGLSTKKPSRPEPQRYQTPPRQPMRPANTPPMGPDQNMVQRAMNYEKAERWEDAARIYEKLELWDEAGRCRRRGKGSTVKHVHVNANYLFKQIRSEGLAVNYRCPKCGGNLDIDGSKNLKFCTFCGTSIDTKTLSKLVNDLLN